MHLLRRLRGDRAVQCLPELRRRVRAAPHPPRDRAARAGLCLAKRPASTQARASLLRQARKSPALPRWCATSRPRSASQAHVDRDSRVSAAATLTTAAFVPQALHIIRYKETRAISLFMYVTLRDRRGALALVRLPDRQSGRSSCRTPSRLACARHHRHEAEIWLSRATRSASAIRPR